MRAVWPALSMICWWGLPLFAGSLGATSFEVGLVGRGVRCVGVSADRPSLSREHPAEGQFCLRWPRSPSAGWAAVQWPVPRQSAGQPVLLMAMMRSETAGLPARLSAHGPDGQVLVQAEFDLSTGWRRYEVTWTPDADVPSGWVELAAGSTTGHQVFWLDDVRLATSDEPAELQPELSAELRGDRIRWAGQSAQFVIRLRSPARVAEVAWQWRVETAAGTIWQRAAGLLRLTDGRGETTVRTHALPPGAYRLVVEALCEGQELRSADSLVTVEPQLGELPCWGGVEGTSAASAVADLVLLRLGRLRHARGEPRGDGIPAERARLLVGARHEGIETLAYWPDQEADLTRWSRLVSWWEPPAGELWRSADADGERLRARRAALGGRGRLCGVRLDGAGRPLEALTELAERDLLSSTDAVSVQAPPGSPEALRALPWPDLVKGCGTRPLWLMLPAWEARPWCTARDADDCAALRQAAWLAQAVLLARFHGLGGVWYPGAPSGLDEARADLAWRGRGADLCDAAGRPQPGLAAMCWALDAMRGRRAGVSPPAPEGVRLLRFDGRRPLLVAWALPGPARPRLSLPLRADEVTAREVGGTPMTLAPGQVSVGLSESPVYLEPLGGALSRFADAAQRAEIRW